MWVKCESLSTPLSISEVVISDMPPLSAAVCGCINNIWMDYKTAWLALIKMNERMKNKMNECGQAQWFKNESA